MAVLGSRVVDCPASLLRIKICTYDDLSRVVRWMNREEERAKANQWPDTWANKNTRAISWYLNTFVIHVALHLSRELNLCSL